MKEKSYTALLTVGELIERLERVSDETIVKVNDGSGERFAYGIGCGDNFEGTESIVIWV